MAHYCVYVAVEYLLVLVVLAYGILEIHEGIKCQQGDDDIRIVGVSYNTCIKECRARSNWCTGVSYHANADMCILHGTGATYGTEAECRGFVYSESQTWQEKTLPCADISCDVTRANCTNGICQYTDCPVPLLDVDLKLKGTDRTTGSKIVYACNNKNKKIDGRKSLTVNCLEGGQWDYLLPPTCT